MTMYDDLKLNYLFTNKPARMEFEKRIYSLRGFLHPVVGSLAEEHQNAFRMQCFGYLSQMLYDYITGVRHEAWQDLYNKKSGIRNRKIFYPFFQNNHFSFGIWFGLNKNISPVIIPKNQIHADEFGKLRKEYGIKHDNNIQICGCNTTMWVYILNCICGEIMPISISIHQRNTEPLSNLFQDNIFIVSLTDQWYKKYTLEGFSELNLYLKNSWFSYNRTTNTTYNYKTPNLNKINKYGYMLVLEWYANDGIYQQVDINEQTRYEHLRRILQCPERF